MASGANPNLWDRMIADLEVKPHSRAGTNSGRFATPAATPSPTRPICCGILCGRPANSFDPNGTDAAFDRMVVVGHSLGGILAKMMVQTSESRLWQSGAHGPSTSSAGRPMTAGCFRRCFTTSLSRGAPGRIYRDSASRQSACERSPSEGSVRGSAGDKADSSRPSKLGGRTTSPVCSLATSSQEHPTSAVSLPPDTRC